MEFGFTEEILNSIADGRVTRRLHHALAPKPQPELEVRPERCVPCADAIFLGASSQFRVADYFEGVRRCLFTRFSLSSGGADGLLC